MSPSTGMEHHFYPGAEEDYGYDDRTGEYSAKKGNLKILNMYGSDDDDSQIGKEVPYAK